MRPGRRPRVSFVLGMSDAGTDGASAERTPNRALGRYRSLFVIGRGGMGSVEAAIEKSLGTKERIVALKKLHADASDARHAEMFLREARLAALLTHPNVVRALDFGFDQGELFLAMEYIEGITLADVVIAARARGLQLPPTWVAAVLAFVCDGLHAAHELRDVGGHLLSVVHRDVSPHNVMVSFDGQVKLLDFGVAKIDSKAGLTKTGEVKGKTAYMSPEQAMGEELDRRSDLYALGAVLYECLLGKRMWGDGTDMDVLRRLALEEPPLLDAAVIPSPLVELHRNLVAKKPSDRPATADEVAVRLRAYAQDASVESSIRAWMVAHFAEEMAERRRRLESHLAALEPDAMATVRDSLAPAPPRVARKRSVVWYAAFAGLAAVTAFTAWIRQQSAPSAVLAGGRAESAATPSEGPATAQPASSATGSTRAQPVTNVPEAPQPAAPSASNARSTRPPLAPRPKATLPTPSTTPTPSPPSKPLDVDPNPI